MERTSRCLGTFEKGKKMKINRKIENHSKSVLSPLERGWYPEFDFCNNRSQRQNYQSEGNDSHISLAIFTTTVNIIITANYVFSFFFYSFAFRCRHRNCLAECERIKQCYASGFDLCERGKLCHKSQVSRSARITSPFRSLYLRSNFCVAVVVVVAAVFSSNS